MTEKRVLVCWALVGLLQLCHSFSSHSSYTKNNVRINTNNSLQPMQSMMTRYNKNSSLFGKATTSNEADDDEDRARRPNIVKINTHEQYVKFLEEDDRVCVIKFYANWCKSCQRFGLKFRHLAFEEGDRISGDSVYHSGNARFAEGKKKFYITRLCAYDMYFFILLTNSSLPSLAADEQPKPS